MSLFSPATNDQAYLKAGFFGQEASGKTYSATQLVIGLHGLLKEKGLPEGDNPVLFMDTETGSSWVKPKFDQAGIQLERSTTRAFKQLVPAIREAQKRKCILLIDSLTHFWVELVDSYLAQKRRDNLHIGDWQFLKGPRCNGGLSEAYVAASAHIVWCARASFEYQFFEDETGKKQMERSGIKPKAETNTGYEPNLVVLMSRHQKFDPDHPERTKAIRYANVLKDRSQQIDGKVFADPTFEDFLPHIMNLNLGGEHGGVDTRDNSQDIIPEGREEWQRRDRQKDIALDEIRELLVEFYPSQTKDDKKAKADLLEVHFGTRSWERVKALSLEPIKAGREMLWLELKGESYQVSVSKPTGSAGVVTSDPEALDAKVQQELEAEFEKETAARTAGPDADLPF